MGANHGGPHVFVTQRLLHGAEGIMFPPQGFPHLIEELLGGGKV